MNSSSIAVRITEDGQIPLPTELQNALGLKPLQEVRLSSRGGELVIRPAADKVPLQERIETILQRAKVRAATLAGEVTTAEAWAIYDEAAAALGQALQGNQSEV